MPRGARIFLPVLFSKTIHCEQVEETLLGTMVG